MIEETPSGEKATRLVIPTFKGIDKDYAIFSERFEAYAGVYGFDSALEEGGKDEFLADDTSLPSDADTKKLQKAAVKRSKVAIANSIMAFTTDETMALVKKTKSSTQGEWRIWWERFERQTSAEGCDILG